MNHVELSDKVMVFALEYARKLEQAGILSSWWVSKVGDYEPTFSEQVNGAPCISVGLQVKSREEGAYEELKRRAQQIVPQSYLVEMDGASVSLPVYFVKRGKARFL